MKSLKIFNVSYLLALVLALSGCAFFDGAASSSGENTASYSAASARGAKAPKDANPDAAAMRSGYRQFYEKYFIKEGALYKRLYEEGQSPKTLIIACSDSRVAPEVIFSSAPGELFVVRNIANIVPPLASAGLNTGTAAAIEYAVEHLHVRNIVVMGHEACGGINALMASAEDSHGGAIADWIHIAAPAKDRTLKLKAATPQLAQTLCEKESVKNSVENLMTFPFVSEKVERGELRLYGWHFSIEKGTVEEVCAK